MSLAELFASPWGGLLIFLLRIVDVSCDTMRVIFAVRGRRVAAALLGFVQALVWIFAVGTALRYLGSWTHVLGYAGGYGMGTFVGISIEQFVAYGLASVQIISRVGGVEIAHALREAGFAVTEHAGFGREGGVEILTTIVQRAHLAEVLAVVDRWDSTAFVTVEEPRVLRGGSVAERVWRAPTRLAGLLRTRQRV